MSRSRFEGSLGAARLFTAAVIAVASIASLAPADVSAQDETGIQAIRGLIRRARFSEAVDAATAYLGREDLTASERNGGLEVLAIAQIANRHDAEARTTLEALYRRDPGHRLDDPDASPPVLSAFARAREAAPAVVSVALDHQPPHLSRREPPVVLVRVSEGGDAVSEVRLIYRAPGEDSARVVMTRRPDGSYVARLPETGDPSTSSEIEYHLVALAPSLTPLATLGSEADPLRISLPADPSGGDSPAVVAVEVPVDDPHLIDTEPTEVPTGGGSVAEEWWFWTLIVGLAVAGAAVTVGLLLGPFATRAEAGTLGTAQLMLRF